MQRFNNILAYVNLASDAHLALARAVRLSRQNNANLTAKTVTEEHPAQAHAVLCPIHLEGARETVERDYHEQLEQLVRQVRDAGLSVQTVVAHGSTVIEVICTVLQRQHDLVIKTVRYGGAHSGSARMLGPGPETGRVCVAGAVKFETKGRTPCRIH